MTKKSGEKFTAKYNVESATVYKGDTASLKIPPPGHPLYDATSPTTFDKLRVEAIDRDGRMTTPIEVWTDPDHDTLWVLDGRGRTHDVREVNRRRALQGRELVKPLILTFVGDEKAAIARVQEKNHHRRVPTPSGMALGLLTMRNAGHTWEACAKALHVDTPDAEQWGRRQIPLAFCEPEVRAAIDQQDLPRSFAPRFGGSALDGSKRLGRQEQLALLEELTQERSKGPKSRGVPPWARERVKEALSNGASNRLGQIEKHISSGIVAIMAWLDGDDDALNALPAGIRSLVEEASTPKKRGPAPKKKTGNA